MIKCFIAMWLLWIPPSCGSSTLGMEATKPPSHHIFDELLRKHVAEDGIVDYRGFQADRAKLGEYLDLLSSNPPDRKSWIREEQLAYWINAYNAFTIELILEHYPVKSIKDIGPKLNIPLLNSVWHLEFFQIGGQKASLDEIEHKILRKEFAEPRIHFAINCASVSCPVLHNRAYEAKDLDTQLDVATRNFINDSKRNRIRADKAEISEIFSWFSGDFTKDGDITDFINRYAHTPLRKGAKITYLPYDWRLNE